MDLKIQGEKQKAVPMMNLFNQLLESKAILEKHMRTHGFKTYSGIKKELLQT